MVPYRDLYVYEISGEISAARGFFKKHFIGCWNEGEVSFLFFSRPHDKEVETFADHRGLQLSGLFHRDGQEVANRLEQRAITIFQRFEEKNWITLTGFNKNVPRD